MTAGIVDPSVSSNFYTHSTVLDNRNRASLEIFSIKMPQLHLRLPVFDDTAALLALFTDPRNIQYDKSCSGLDNVTAVRALIEQWNTVGYPLERANIIVTVAGKTIGTGGLGWIGKRTDGKWVGDAGMMLDSNFRRKGYAYESLAIIIDHGFRVLDMDEIHLACVGANVAFRGLMDVKFGFQAAPHHDRFGNEWVWQITKEMWRESCHSAEGREGNPRLSGAIDA